MIIMDEAEEYNKWRKEWGLHSGMTILFAIAFPLVFLALIFVITTYDYGEVIAWIATGSLCAIMILSILSLIYGYKVRRFTKGKEIKLFGYSIGTCFELITAIEAILKEMNIKYKKLGEQKILFNRYYENFLTDYFTIRIQLPDPSEYKGNPVPDIGISIGPKVSTNMKIVSEVQKKMDEQLKPFDYDEYLRIMKASK